MSSSFMNKALTVFTFVRTFANSIIVIFELGRIDWSRMVVSNNVISTGLSLFLEVFLACLDRSRDRIRQ